MDELKKELEEVKVDYEPPGKQTLRLISICHELILEIEDHRTVRHELADRGLKVQNEIALLKNDWRVWRQMLREVLEIGIVKPLEEASYQSNTQTIFERIDAAMHASKKIVASLSEEHHEQT